MGSVSKAIKRVIPKEIQPILPIAASMFGGPLVGSLLPSFGSGIGALALRQGLASGLTSAGVDLLTKGKVDPRTTGIAALMGGGGQYFKGAGETGKFFGKELGEKAKSAFIDAGTLLAPTEIGESGKFELAEGIGKEEVLGSLGKSAGTAATVGGSIAAYDAAEQARREYDEKMAGREADAAADRQARIDYITQYMELAGFSQQEIDEALRNAGYQNGGRVGFEKGGIMNLKMGGMPAEMDLRGGGFVPIGVKEKADDVPARLSKNEFVMTADAVRAAGGGSVNKGAKKMYDLMNKLEARV